MSLSWYPEITIDVVAGTIAGIAPTTYRVTNRNSGKCLDVASASTANGANVIQYTCGSGTNQQWQLQTVGGYVQLVARHSGKCLDVVNAGTGDGADIQQYACNGGTNQQWSRTQV